MSSTIRHLPARLTFFAAVLVCLATGAFAAPDPLGEALAGGQRTDKERARDVYRHPRETLEFFGVKASDSVIEVEPGGGWYSAILAPYLANQGHLYLAPYISGQAKSQAEEAEMGKLITTRMASDAPHFGQVTIGALKGGAFTGVAAPGSADVVLTFRNLHNWIENGQVDDNLRAFYAALKPGGVLGIEEHRARAATPLNIMISSGYVTEAYVIEHAKSAGFVLDGSSPINDNPRDTKDYADGVWALPPTLRGGATDRDKYLAIGESDRMTLRFRKPLTP